MKTFGRVLFLLIVVIFYLNIGWGIGTYAHNHVFMKTPETMAEKISSVNGLLTYSEKTKKDADSLNSLKWDQAVFMLFWPVFLALSIFFFL